MTPAATGNAAPILIVDDDRAVGTLISRILRGHGLECVAVEDAAEASCELDAPDAEFTLMLCDVHMPGESGLELIRRAHERHPELAILMISGAEDADVAESALELGAYGYIVKPFRPAQLLINVSSALRRRQLEIESRAHRELLKEHVSLRTIELRSALQRLEQAATKLRRSREETITRLSRAVEFKDPDTAGHVERVSRYCELTARRLGVGGTRCEEIRITAPMHDVGKIAVPDSILLKPGPLTTPERAAMESHAEVGHDLLAGSSSSLLELAATIAWTHHEKWDGSGYPRGLAEEQIPLEGRIVAVADVFDALTSDRPYRDAFPVERGLEILRSERDKHFDPTVLDAFLESLDETEAVAAPASSDPPLVSSTQ